MRKVKLFRYSEAGIFLRGVANLEDDVNEFLAKDGKEIEVLDVKFSIGQGYYGVLVYYNEIKK